MINKQLLLIGLFVTLFFGLKAQKGIDFDQVVFFDNQNASVEKLLTEVKNVTSISFSYSSSLINPSSIIYLPKTELTFKEFLDVISEQLSVDYIEFNDKILFIAKANQQEDFWIDGYIRDATSGESLIGAMIYNSSRNIVTETNEFGYYSLKVTSGSQVIRYSYIGYKAEFRTDFSPNKSRVNLSLKPAFTIPNIVITPSDSLASIRQIDEEIEASLLVFNPGLLGENNILQSIKFLPGIQSGGEVQGNILVQGGGPDQNLVLMDGVPIYEVNHLLGLTSIFSNDAVNSVELETSGFNSKYGGRLSSVINVKIKDGNKFKHQSKLSMGLLGASLHAEGPLNKGTSSYLISGRTSFINQIIEPLAKNYLDVLNTNFNYSDLNLKLHHNITKNSSLSLGAFIGNDNLGFDNRILAKDGEYDIEALTTNSINWNNLMYNIRYNRVVNEKLVFTMSASAVNYDLISRASNEIVFDNGDTTISNELDVFAISVIDDKNLKTDWEYKTTENQTLLFGGGTSAHIFSPSIISRDQINPNFRPSPSDGINATEQYIYMEDRVNFSEYFKLSLGFHFSRFLVENNEFTSFQPRLKAEVFFNERTDLSFSYSEMTQFIHLLVNPGTGLPADLWLPSTEKIRPEETTHYNLQIRRKWSPYFMSTASGYLKYYRNLIDYTSASPLFNPIITQPIFFPIINNARDWEDRVEVGQGSSYGVNVFHSYISSKIRASLSYSFGYSTRQFDNINKGEPFRYKYDRRHDIGFLFQYQLNKSWNYGLNWVYGSGGATTFATTEFLSLEGEPILDFSQRNNFQMPDYHRLDLSASYSKRVGNDLKLGVDFGIYNAYNRQNPFFVYLTNDNKSGDFEPRQVSIFPILPFLNLSLSYN